MTPLNGNDEQEPGTVAGPHLDLPNEADILFDGMLIGSGWHSPEVFEGVCFRWMGSEESARVSVVIDRATELELSVYVPHMVDHERWDAVAFQIDGEPVAAELVEGDVRRFVMRAPARFPRAPEPQPQCVMFRSVQARRAAELAASGCLLDLEIFAPFAQQPNPSDARTLSIAVSLLRIRPVAGAAIARNRAAMRGALLSYFKQHDLSGIVDDGKIR